MSLLETLRRNPRLWAILGLAVILMCNLNAVASHFFDIGQAASPAILALCIYGYVAGGGRRGPRFVASMTLLQLYIPFYAIFGFTACVTLVLIAKQMRRILKRKEDYYDVDD